MTSLTYLLDHPTNYVGINRAEYPTLKSKVVFSGCANHELITAQYQRLGYPLGKSRRGLKKWTKRRIKRYGMYALECAECGKPVWDYPLLWNLLSKLKI